LCILGRHHFIEIIKRLAGDPHDADESGTIYDGGRHAGGANLAFDRIRDIYG
jgi:hypothetical protein